MEPNADPGGRDAQNQAEVALKPRLHPVLAVILTIIIIGIGLVIGSALGAAVLGLFGMVIMAALSLTLTVPLTAKFFNAPTNTTTQARQGGASGLAKAAAIGLVVAGLIIGFFVGAIVNFGACFKSDCHPLQASAPLTIPVATLLLTVPHANKVFRRRDEVPTSLQPTPPQTVANPPPMDNSQPIVTNQPLQPQAKSSKKGVWGLLALIGITTIGGLLLVVLALTFIAAVFIVPVGISSLNPTVDKSPAGIAAKYEDSEEKAAAIQRVGDAFSAIDTNIPSLTYIASSIHDACYEVQVGDKWSPRQEPECAYRKTQFYGFNSDHQETLINIENALLKNGWESRYGVERPIRAHFDRVAKWIASGEKNTYGANAWLIRNQDYTKDDLIVEIADAEKGASFSYGFTSNQEIPTYGDDYEVKNLQDVEALAEDVFVDYTYMLSVSVDEKYYTYY